MAEPRYEIIAVTGEAVPGSDLILDNLPHLQVDHAGGLVLSGLALDGEESVRAVWRAERGEPFELALVSGDPVPNALEGETFASIGTPVPLPSGELGLAANFDGPAGPREGFWLLPEFGPLEPVLLAGWEAPGIPGATFLDLYGVQHDSEWGADGALVTTSELVRTGDVTGDNDKVVTYWPREGEPRLLARAGTAAPGLEGETWISFHGVAERDGTVAFGSTAPGLNALYRWQPEFTQPELVIRSGDPVPGEPPDTVVLGAAAEPFLFLPDGSVAFDFTYIPPPPLPFGLGILLARPTGELERLVLPGDTAPGPTGRSFERAGVVAATPAGAILIEGEVDVPWFPERNASDGLWLLDEAGGLEPLLLGGQPLPGHEPRWLLGASGLESFSDDGDLSAVVSTCTGPGPRCMDSRWALLLVRRDGPVRALLFSGDALDLGSGDVGVVDRLAPGQVWGNEVATSVLLEDGRRVVLFVPEPHATWLLAIGGTLLAVAAARRTARTPL